MILDSILTEEFDTVVFVRTNVEKVLERDTKLSSLDSRAKELEIGASQFEQQGRSLARRDNT